VKKEKNRGLWLRWCSYQDAFPSQRSFEHIEQFLCADGIYLQLILGKIRLRIGGHMDQYVHSWKSSV
jgi:hypothetical protein